jgi:hypothetical protein
LWDNIKIDLKGIVWKDVNLINLAVDKDQWRILVVKVMNIWIPKKGVKFIEQTDDCDSQRELNPLKLQMRKSETNSLFGSALDID